MEEIACTCDDLPPHSHVYRVSLDPGLNDKGTIIKYVQDPYDVRIWVDWKALAREVIVEARLDEKIDALHGPGAAAAIDKAYADGSIFSDGGKN